MGILLNDLVADLTADVPAVDGVPSSDQYERAVVEAAADFSRRCGTEKIAQLVVVAGTAAYGLPDDFEKMIIIETPYSPDGVLVSVSGLIPLPQNWTERYTIRNRQITFSPTPTYSMTKDYRYKAGWALNDAGDEYEDMGQEEADIILLKAAATCLTRQANVGAPEAFSYRQGDVAVDTSGSVTSTRSEAEGREKAYLAAVDRYNGRYGILE